MAGENDVVGAQSRRRGLGNLVAKHQPCSVSPPLLLVLKIVSKDKNKNEQRTSSLTISPTISFFMVLLTRLSRVRRIQKWVHHTGACPPHSVVT